jgi:hypothetical protein
MLKLQGRHVSNLIVLDVNNPGRFDAFYPIEKLKREALVKLLLNEYRDLAVGQRVTEYSNKRGSD